MIVLTLPLEYRPTLIEKFVCAAGIEHAIIDIFPNGSVQLTAALDVTEVSLTNIRFAPAPVVL